MISQSQGGNKSLNLKKKNPSLGPVKSCVFMTSKLVDDWLDPQH